MRTSQYLRNVHKWLAAEAALISPTAKHNIDGVRVAANMTACEARQLRKQERMLARKFKALVQSLWPDHTSVWEEGSITLNGKDVAE